MAQASVSIEGTAPNQTINFEIPQGPRGPQGIQGPKGDSGSTAPQKNQIFAVRYISGAWEYSSLSAAVSAGLDPAQTIWFINGPSAPAWARSGDIVTLT